MELFDNEYFLDLVKANMDVFPPFVYISSLSCLADF